MYLSNIYENSGSSIYLIEAQMNHFQHELHINLELYFKLSTSSSSFLDAGFYLVSSFTFHLSQIYSKKSYAELNENIPDYENPNTSAIKVLAHTLHFPERRSKL